MSTDSKTTSNGDDGTVLPLVGHRSGFETHEDLAKFLEHHGVIPEFATADTERFYEVLEAIEDAFNHWPNPGADLRAGPEVRP